jgi:hypothetical protein
LEYALQGDPHLVIGKIIQIYKLSHHFPITTTKGVPVRQVISQDFE